MTSSQGAELSLFVNGKLFLSGRSSFEGIDIYNTEMIAQSDDSESYETRKEICRIRKIMIRVV